jgi:hypothetical protein
MIVLLLDPALKQPINSLLTPTLTMVTMTLPTMIIIPLLLMVTVMARKSMLLTTTRLPTFF